MLSFRATMEQATRSQPLSGSEQQLKGLLEQMKMFHCCSLVTEKSNPTEATILEMAEISNNESESKSYLMTLDVTDEDKASSVLVGRRSYRDRSGRNRD